MKLSNLILLAIVVSAVVGKCGHGCVHCEWNGWDTYCTGGCVKGKHIVKGPHEAYCDDDDGSPIPNCLVSVARSNEMALNYCKYCDKGFGPVGTPGTPADPAATPPVTGVAPSYPSSTRECREATDPSGSMARIFFTRKESDATNNAGRYDTYLTHGDACLNGKTDDDKLFDCSVATTTGTGNEKRIPKVVEGCIEYSKTANFHCVRCDPAKYEPSPVSWGYPTYATADTSFWPAASVSTGGNTILSYSNMRHCVPKGPWYGCAGSVYLDKYCSNCDERNGFYSDGIIREGDHGFNSGTTLQMCTNGSDRVGKSWALIVSSIMILVFSLLI